MKLSTHQIQNLTEIAINAALKAGAIVAENAERTIKVIKKEGGFSRASQVLTEVDLKSQECILSYLTPTLAPFELGLLTEEMTDDKSRFENDYFWCVDPLDGTLSFIESTHGYSISIALVAKDGIPVLGVIFDPLKNILYHAIKDRGVFKNNEIWKFDSSVNRKLTFIHDRSFLKHPNYSKVIEGLKQMSIDFKLNHLNIIHTGGAALNACWVIENAPACYFKFPTEKKGGGSLWDFAASACIFSEMGLHVSDYNLDNLDLNRPDSTFMNHRGILFSSKKQLAKQINKLSF
ncbi:MAG: hypothetical protein PF541_00555 [Prolixibacteraceae bacterium]|jgi:3'-phosphoadenosine 5'-phosphosulfate (PAPS) 3'-phosphatase|nr:hypothetical protein [Prolixibacteraceae bacterium]